MAGIAFASLVGGLLTAWLAAHLVSRQLCAACGSRKMFLGRRRLRERRLLRSQIETAGTADAWQMRGRLLLLRQSAIRRRIQSIGSPARFPIGPDGARGRQTAAACPNARRVRDAYLASMKHPLVCRRLLRYIQSHDPRMTSDAARAGLEIVKRQVGFACFALVAPHRTASLLLGAAIEQRRGERNLILCMEWPAAALAACRRLRWLLVEPCCHEFAHVWQQVRDGLLDEEWSGQLTVRRWLRAEFEAHWYASPMCLFGALVPALLLLAIALWDTFVL